MTVEEIHRLPLQLRRRESRGGDRVPTTGVMLQPEIETRAWSEQLALDDESYRTQLAYLLERSVFYREKLAEISPEHALADIAELPLTDKAELRATITPENPFGAHLCAAPEEIVPANVRDQRARATFCTTSGRATVVIMEKPSTCIPHARAAEASSVVDMPTASAPMRRNARYSARVS